MSDEPVVCSICHLEAVANLRKAKPVRRLSQEEIAALEHARNLGRYLDKAMREGALRWAKSLRPACGEVIHVNGPCGRADCREPRRHSDR